MSLLKTPIEKVKVTIVGLISLSNIEIHASPWKSVQTMKIFSFPIESLLLNIILSSNAGSQDTTHVVRNY